MRFIRSTFKAAFDKCRSVSYLALAILCFSTLFLIACSTSSSSVSTLSKNQGAAYSVPTETPVPEPLQNLSEKINDNLNNEPMIDTSHINEGYIIAAAVAPNRLKLQVTCNEMSYNYDLPADGAPIVVPTNMGDGTYVVRVMQNIKNDEYSELTRTEEEVVLDSEFAPFLVPNVFCNYSADSACAIKAREIAKDATTKTEALADICEWVADNIQYDTNKAESLSNATGYVPSPDQTLEAQSGICFDYASLCTAMLRSIGIPAKMVTGYVGQNHIYHAWVMAYVDGTWKTERFSVDANTWSRCDVTLASAGDNEFVGDGSAYTDRFVY